MPGTLYVVATPIGNLEDITLRALSVLKSVGLIAAEDTRRTAILLRHFGIDTPSTSLHEHNERKKLPRLVQKMVDGVDIALVSDAGTPLIADPGWRLVVGAIAEGIRVVPIPGASAVLSAMAVSGFGGDSFIFAGFAPSRSTDRKSWLASVSAEERPVVFFEAPHRVRRTLDDIASVLVDRPIMIGRELTKLHEEVIRTTSRDVATLKVPERGEFTIIIGPSKRPKASHEVADADEVMKYFCHLTEREGRARRAAAALTGRKFGLSTNFVYQLVEKGKGAGPS